MMPKCVIFDIDGVLAEKSPERDYREYDKVDLDKPIYQMFELLEMYIINNDKIDIIWITGRKELCRDKTINFLYNNMCKSNSVLVYKYMSYLAMEKRYICLVSSISNSLFMRPDNDHRKAVVLKKELYETHIKGKYEVELAIDDDPEICEMWKQEGIFTLEVKR